LMAFIDEQFRANAADVTSPSGDENFHTPKRDARRQPVKNEPQTPFGLRLFALQARDHSTNASYLLAGP
jgi:hypothetical protein